VKPSFNSIQPSRKDFIALAKKHTLVPVYHTLTADLETPVSLPAGDVAGAGVFSAGVC